MRRELVALEILRESSERSATFRARLHSRAARTASAGIVMSPPDADTPAGLSEVDLERSLKGTPRPVPTSPRPNPRVPRDD